MTNEMQRTRDAHLRPNDFFRPHIVGRTTHRPAEISAALDVQVISQSEPMRFRRANV